MALRQAFTTNLQTGQTSPDAFWRIDGCRWQRRPQALIVTLHAYHDEASALAGKSPIEGSERRFTITGAALQTVGQAPAGPAELTALQAGTLNPLNWLFIRIQKRYLKNLDAYTAAVEVTETDEPV